MPVVLPLIDLGALLVLVGALIFIYLCTYIAKALFGLAGGTLGKLPVVGGWINSGLHSVEQKIVSVMATAAQGVDDAMGFTLHETARLIDWTGREIAAHANLLTRLAQSMPGAGALGALRGEIIALRRLLHGGFAAQLTQFRHLLDLEKRLQHGIGADVLPRIHGLERGFARTIEHDIGSLRTRDRVLAREYQRLYKWTRTHALAAGTLAFAGAVAVALSRLGMGWLRCNNVKRLGKQACGMDANLLESLLAGSLAIVGTISLVELARELQAITPEVVDGVRVVIREA